MSLFYYAESELGKVKVIILKEVIYLLLVSLLHKHMYTNCELIMVFDS